MEGWRREYRLYIGLIFHLVAPKQPPASLSASPPPSFLLSQSFLVLFYFFSPLHRWSLVIQLVCPLYLIPPPLLLLLLFLLIVFLPPFARLISPPRCGCNLLRDGWAGSAITSPSSPLLLMDLPARLLGVILGAARR